MVSKTEVINNVMYIENSKGAMYIRMDLLPILEEYFREKSERNVILKEQDPDGLNTLKNTIIIDELTNLKYPLCFTSHEKCAKCEKFGGECTDKINDIDTLRHELGELIDLR